MIVGNGAALPISIIGNSCLHSLRSNTLLRLDDILCVPLIKKILLNVSRFTNDNYVFFEFHPIVCYVKDQTTKQVLLEGKLRNGLYALPIGAVKPLQVQSSVFSTQCTHYKSATPTFFTDTQQTATDINILSMWHDILGHLAISIVKYVLASYNKRT